MAVILYIVMMMIYIAVFGVSNFVFVDESGLQKHYFRIKCRARRGVKIYAKKPGRKFKKTNIIAGLLYGTFGKKHVAAYCYEHATNADFFENWFEWQLLAEVPEYSLIIMDNAAFHRKKQLTEIAAKYNILVVFLPPYSPEFNPIEHSWANFKRWLCDNLNCFPCIEMAADCYFSD
jgi:hypothetical protein